MKILIDAMGGDHAPHEIIKGTLNALKQKHFKAVFFGDENLIDAELSHFDYKESEVEIVHTTEVIGNDESPALAIRRKKDSSIVKALQMLNEGKADGFISAGSTGALLAGGMVIVKRLKTIQRAALVSVYPTMEGMSLIVDAGANADINAETLFQFAQMASKYYENIFEVRNPKVGLLNIGTEKAKGNQLVLNTYPILKESNLNFIGNVEAREVPYGMADIVVTDGFTGNVVLKLTEGMAFAMVDRFKAVLLKNLKTKIAAAMLKSSLKEMKEGLDYREYGAVPLLGLNAPVFKAHGSSDAFAIENGIYSMLKFIEKDVINQLRKTLMEDE